MTTLFKVAGKPEQVFYKRLLNAAPAVAEMTRRGLLIDPVLLYAAAATSEKLTKKAKDLLARCDNEGRIHTHYIPCGTITGRFSSEDYPLHNLDNCFKCAVVPTQDYSLICADYSQIEPRILAYLSKDKALLNALKSEYDLYTSIVAVMLGVSPNEVTHEQRNIGKTSFLACTYGAREKGLQKMLKDKGIVYDEEQCGRLLGTVYSSYPRMAMYMGDQFTNIVRQGIKPFYGDACVQTASGRSIPINIFSNKYKTRVINYICQGTGASVLLEALCALPKAFEGYDVHYLHMVHDEILLEAPQACAQEVATKLSEAMTNAFYTVVAPEAERIPCVQVGIGKSWDEAKNHAA